MAIARTDLQIPGFAVNTAPDGFNPVRDLPEGFLAFYSRLHERFSSRRLALVEQRRQRLEDAWRGKNLAIGFPRKLFGTDGGLSCQRGAGQRNQMTGPADDAELVVKMMNSGAPGVMLDLEDSMVNEWEHQQLGQANILSALRGSLTYFDKKRDSVVGIKPSATVTWIRPRGLHISQDGVLAERTSASLFDVASIAFRVDASELKHPLAFYISKSESAEEALWWRDVFQAIAEMRGWPRNYIKCMALVESHPLAFQMKKFCLICAIHRWFESWPLGLHGQPHSFQPGRSRLGDAGPRHDPS